MDDENSNSAETSGTPGSSRRVSLNPANMFELTNQPNDDCTNNPNSNFKRRVTTHFLKSPERFRKAYISVE